EVTAWQDYRNKHHAKADWQFTTANARVKLKRLYPQFEWLGRLALGRDRSRKRFRRNTMQHIEPIDQIRQYAELDKPPPLPTEHRLALLHAERIGSEEISLGRDQSARIRLPAEVDDRAVDGVARRAGRI